MSDDFEDKPRGKKNKGSGDNTLKIVLIVFASFFGLMFVVCCGGGAFLYYQMKLIAERADIKNPADIQKLTAEMTDITIPSEFVPQHGSAIPLINMKIVQYAWCPTGSCPPGIGPENLDQDNLLALTSFDLGENAGPQPDGAELSEDADVSDESLKMMWKDFTKAEHTFTIRGKACKFTIISGEEFATPQFNFEDEGESPPLNNAEASPATNSDPDPDPNDAEPDAEMPVKQPADQPGTGKKIVQATGSFPGKKAECSLRLRLKAEDYQEEKILEMLKSIR